MLTYEEAAAGPSDIFEHLPTLVDLVVELDAQTVIELGVGTDAPSTVAFLYALAKTGGHLWSVDVLPAPFDAPDWTFIEGDDLSDGVLDQLPNSADIVFIDTLHTYSQTSAELALYRPRVRPGGRIVLHDTELDRHEARNLYDPPYPVKQAVIEFVALYGYEWTNRPNCNGLAIIEIPC